MSGFSFTSGSIENLKNQVDIVDVISQVVPLKRAGANYKGLCPFHNEKTPSFVVSEQNQRYNCFGCGAYGDVIDFVMRHYNMDFSDAVEKLASDYGIEMERSSYDDHRNEYYEINRIAARFFYDALTGKANRGYHYMKNRGISPAIMKKFGIGYADDQWDSLYQHLKSQGIEEKKMQELGLVSSSKGKFYDRFRNRVMFPIINTSGKVIGFGGRAIGPDDNPKYLNSPESLVFQKKNNLYGLNISRQAGGKAGYIILVEGYMDVISLYQSGVENVAASLGTALTENQARLLKRYVKEVVLSYDADSAGRKAALRGIEVLRSEGCKVRVLHVTDGKDPDEYVKKFGRDAFLSLIDTALPYGEYKLAAAASDLDLSADEDRLEYMNRAVAILKNMGALEQDVYKKKLSRDLGVAESVLDRALQQDQEQPQRPAASRKNPEDPPIGSDMSPIEKTLLKLVLTDESFAGPTLTEEDMVQSPLLRKVLELIKEESAEWGSAGFKDIRDRLTFEEAEQVTEIMNKVRISPDHEKVFDDCVRRSRQQSLERQEKEILTRLSMADAGDDVRDLTSQLMKIQKKRKSIAETGESTNE